MVSKILLVIPNSRWYKTNVEWHLHPYQLGLIAANLDRNIYNIEIYDANIDNTSREDFSYKIKEYSPCLVGFTVLSNEFGVTAHIGCEIVKKVSKDIVTIVGGVYATTRPRDCIMDHNVNYVAIGEGENLFRDLLEYLNGRAELPSKGLAFRDKNKAIIGDNITVQCRADLIQDLDALPYPAYDLIDMGRYSNQSFKAVVDRPRALPYAKLNTSRGCPIGCTFCQVETIAGRNTRFLSPERVLDEMEFLIDNYNIKAFEFEDDNFLGNRTRVIKLFNGMIDRGISNKIVWNAANVSVFFLSEKLLDLMWASGCKYISFAIESGGPRVLKEIINKPVKHERAKELVDYAKKLGMDTTTLWIIGFPSETWDEIRETVRVAEWFDSDYTKINVATPYPGTILFDKAVEGGYLTKDFDFDNLVWGSATYSTEEFAADELDILRTYEWDRINFTSPLKRDKISKMMGISPAELDTIRLNTRLNCFNNPYFEKER
mgnify:CR=1 FL=1